MKCRFEIAAEPSNYNIVWDRHLDEPAMFGGRLLGGMDEQEAKAACQMLNQAYERYQQDRSALQAMKDGALHKRASA